MINATKARSVLYYCIYTTNEPYHFLTSVREIYRLGNFIHSEFLNVYLVLKQQFCFNKIILDFCCYKIVGL